MKDAYLSALPEDWERWARVFAALGDAHRQRILLAFEKEERLNIGRIVACSPLSRSAVSHHLKVLRDAGVLQSEKIGKEVYFRVDRKHLISALTLVLDYVRKAT
jgi:ArsR family transcriptional regulator, arsenate/arsenite/antimonite-responsive transcriptional repressor